MLSEGSHIVKFRKFPSWWLLVAALPLMAACGDSFHPTIAGSAASDPFEGGDSPRPENEPNDSAATATRLSETHGGAGDVLEPGDTDYWRFEALAGDVVRVEIFGVRSDQATWDESINVPRLRLLHPDGHTVLLMHDASGFLGARWDHGYHDLDIPAFPVSESGTYYVCVTQDDQSRPGGAYRLGVQILEMGSLQREAEPVGEDGINDQVEFAESIAPGVVVGFHQAGERDVFRIEVREPTILYAEVLAYRNGRFRSEPDYYDPIMYLLGPDGETEIQFNDDVYFSDCALSQRLVTPGTYYLVVGEHSVGISAPYLLTLGMASGEATPEEESNDWAAMAHPIAYETLIEGTCNSSDEDWFSFEGEAGDLVHVWIFDLGNSEGATTDVRATFWMPDGTSQLASSNALEVLPVARTMLLSAGMNYVRIRSSATTTYAFVLRRFKTAAYESLDNDSLTMADPLDAEGRAAGAMDVPDDVDVYKFHAVAGALVRVRVFAERGRESNGFSPLAEHGSDFEPVLTIVDPQLFDVAGIAYTGPRFAQVSGEGTADGLPTLTLIFVPQETGMHYVRVEEQGGGFGRGYHYLLEIE